MEADDRRDEEALRRGVLRGDEAAFRALYGRSFPTVLDWVHARTGRDRQATEEIVQERGLVFVAREYGLLITTASRAYELYGASIPPDVSLLIDTVPAGNH